MPSRPRPEIIGIPPERHPRDRRRIEWGTGIGPQGTDCAADCGRLRRVMVVNNWVRLRIFRTGPRYAYVRFSRMRRKISLSIAALAPNASRLALRHWMISKASATMHGGGSMTHRSLSKSRAGTRRKAWSCKIQLQRGGSAKLRGQELIRWRVLPCSLP